MLVEKVKQWFGEAGKPVCFILLFPVSLYTSATEVSVTRFTYHPPTHTAGLSTQMSLLSVSETDSRSLGSLVPLASMTVTPTLSSDTSEMHSYWTALSPKQGNRVIIREIERVELSGSRSQWIVYEDVAPDWDSPSSMPKRNIGEAWKAIEDSESTTGLKEKGYRFKTGDENTSQNQDQASMLPTLEKLRVSYILAKFFQHEQRTDRRSHQKYKKLKEWASERFECWKSHPVIDDFIGADIMKVNALFAKIPGASSMSDLSGQGTQQPTKYAKYFIGFEYIKRTGEGAVAEEVRWDIISGKEGLFSEEASSDPQVAEGTTTSTSAEKEIRKQALVSKFQAAHLNMAKQKSWQLEGAVAESDRNNDPIQLVAQPPGQAPEKK